MASMTYDALALHSSSAIAFVISKSISFGILSFGGASIHWGVDLTFLSGSERTSSLDAGV